MLYRKITAVCSQINTKHINTLCGQNVDLLNVKLVVDIVTTAPLKAMQLHRGPLFEGPRNVCLYIIFHNVHHRTDHEDPKGQYRYSCSLAFNLVTKWRSATLPDRFPPGKDPVPPPRTGGGGGDGCGRSAPPPGIDPRTVQPVVANSLYWLSYSIRNIQGVSKRALQLWKLIEIYTEDTHNVLNCQNVSKHTEFYLG
jgi:hypothetical protein